MAAFDFTFGSPFAPHSQSATAAFTSFSLDGATDAIEFIFQAKEAATLTRIGMRLNTITGTTPTYIASLQGVDTSGNPDGTIKGGGSSASKTFSPSGLGWAAGEWRWLTLDNSYACTRGESLAIVLAYSSGTVDASNFASISHSITNVINCGLPYSIENAAGTRTRSTGFSIFGYGSAGTAYGRPAETVGQQSYNANSTPDEYMMKFTVPSGLGSIKVRGTRFLGVLTAAGSYTVTLYESDGTTSLAACTLDMDMVATNSSSRKLEVLFTSEATLMAGSTYYLSVLPVSTQAINVHLMTVDAAADWDAWDFGQNALLSTRTNAGAITDDATRRPCWELIASDITPRGYVIGG